MKKYTFNLLLGLLLTVPCISLAQINFCGFQDFEQTNSNNGLVGGGDVAMCFGSGDADLDQLYIIPTVVHVLYQPGDDQSITDEQIYETLDWINNADYWHYDESLNIQLKLARIDPDGNCTTGINRIPNELISVNYNLDEACGDYMTRDQLHDLGEWTTENYLNIYIVDRIRTSSCEYILENPDAPSALHGFASPPWYSNDADGIVIRGASFGITGQANNTAVMALPHELGHYFGLFHTNGTDLMAIINCDDLQNLNCEETLDRVCDTEVLSVFWTGVCSEDLENADSYVCGDYQWDGTPHSHPFENMMDYPEVDCENHFTVGQKNRMRCYLDHMPRLALWQDSNLIDTGLDLCNLNPIAELGCDGEEIQVIYSADFEPDYQYEWTFGGDITSDLHAGEITLDEIGDGLITLTVTDECSSVEVYSIHTDDLLEELSIQIEQVSCYEFNLSVPECLVNSWSILWHHGDGTGGQGANVNHVYCPSIDPYEGFAAFLIPGQLSSAIVDFSLSTCPPDISLDVFETSCSQACDGQWQIQDPYAVNITWDGESELVQTDVDTWKTDQNVCAGSYTATIEYPGDCFLEYEFVVSSADLQEYTDVLINSAESLNDIEANSHFSGNIEFTVDAIVEDMNWFFSTGSQIIIHEGVEVTFLNCHLRACGTNWSGIEVLSSNLAVGKLNMQDCLIEHAECAIKTRCADPNYQFFPANSTDPFEATISYPADMGVLAGVLNIVDTDFNNNLKSVQVIEGVDDLEESSFVRAVFFIDDELYNHFNFELEDEQFRTHVELWLTKGYDFFSCTFVNSILDQNYNPALWNDRGIGLSTWNSKFVVDSAEEAPNPSSEFRGLQFGISAENTNDPWNRLQVLNSTFSNNQVAMFFHDICFHDVLHNDVFIGPQGDLPDFLAQSPVDYEGIYQQRGAFYIIAENEFTGIGEPVVDNLFLGVRNRDNNTRDNEIYRNQFNNLIVGCQAEGDNGGNIDNGGLNWSDFGLRYSCNTFQNCNTDITARDYDGLEIVEVALFQYGLLHDDFGSPELPEFPDEVEMLRAANSFTNTTFSDLTPFGHWDNQGDLITYLCGASDECVENVDPDAVINQIDDGSEFIMECNQIVLLSSNEEYLEAIDEILLKEEIDLWTEVSFDLEFLLHSLIDGGDQDDLHHDMDFAWVEDTWVMRDKLISKSPYLSRETLKKVADNTVVFPHVVATEIFMANPELLKDKKLLLHLTTKPEPLPDYLLDLILESRNSKTFRTVLTKKMAVVQSLLEQLKGLQQRIYRLDYNANLEYIQQDFESNRLFYIYDRIENELANNRQVSAEHWYNVTGDLKLNKDDRLEYDAYIDWINLGLSDADWLDAETIPVPTKNTLKTMAEDHWFQIHGQRAMSWLNHIDGGSLYIPPAKESSNRSFTRSSISERNGKEDLRVYPNPSNNNLYFYGSKVEKAHSLVLMNELGQVVFEQILNSSYGYIDTSELSEGVYLLAFKGHNELTTEKFIVQH